MNGSSRNSDALQFGHLVGALDGEHLAVHLVHPVDDRRGGGDQIQAELALQPFLDDLHVQQPQKSAAETETQGNGGLRLEGEGGIVQLELGQGIAQLFVLDGIDRVQAGEDHRLDLFEAVQRHQALPVQQGDRITDLGIGNILDAGNDKTDLAGGQLRHLDHDRGEDTDLERLIGLVGGHELDLVTLFQGAVEQAHQDDDPLVLVVPGIEQQRLQRALSDPPWEPESS